MMKICDFIKQNLGEICEIFKENKGVIVSVLILSIFFGYYSYLNFEETKKRLNLENIKCDFSLIEANKGFDIAYEQLKEALVKFDNTSFQIMTLLLTTIGFFVASDNIKVWLQSSWFPKFIFLIIVSFGAIQHIVTISSYKIGSQYYYKKALCYQVPYERFPINFLLPLVIGENLTGKFDTSPPPQLYIHLLLFLILIILIITPSSKKKKYYSWHKLR